MNQQNKPEGVEGVSAEQPHDDLEPFNTQDFYELMHTYRHIPITRQKEVIAAFDEVRNWIRENYVPVKKWAELRKERDALIRTCQKTESALAECRWIPVSEKLPGESVGVVLIRIDEERMKKWAGEPSAGGDYKFYEDNFSAEVDMWNTVAVRHWAQNADWLTHWRPLPNPPVEGERQEPVDREEK